MNDMQVSVERGDNLSRRLSVIVPKSQLEAIKSQRLVELSKKAKLDGFRPGKVPLSVINKLYGENIWHEVVEKSFQSSLSTALAQEALNPAGQPHIESMKSDPGTDLSYTVSFEVYPSLKFPDLKGVTLERVTVVITESDIDQTLERIRYQHAEWVEVQRKAQYGDQVTFDLISTEADAESSKSLQWVLKEGEIPEGFSSLLGSSAGETFSISLPKKTDLDESSHPATLVVKKIAEVTLPSLENTAYIKRLDVAEGTIEALRCQIRRHMEIELDRILREKLKAQLMDYLFAQYSLDQLSLPKTLIEQELQRLEWNVRKKHKQTGNVAQALSEDEKAELMAMARRRVMAGLLFNMVIERYQLEVDEARVQEQVDKVSSVFQLHTKVRENFYKDKRLMAAVRTTVLEEQVFDKLLEDISFVEKKVEYAEIMNFA